MVSEYERNAQRYIYPLYMADGRGGYEFSSTMTFVRLKNENFCVFAAHAIPLKISDLDRMGVLTPDGEFLALSEIEVSHKICRERDLVACHTKGDFQGRNYFDLSAVESSTEFVENFGWIGFPRKKAVNAIHNTKASKEEIKTYIEDGVEGFRMWTIAKFLLLGVEQQSESESEIVGIHINKNVNYEREGFKKNGYSLRGMSGGALFRGPKKINTKSPGLGDLYQFCGIGLEYKDNRMVRGASRHSVQRLLEEF